MLEKPPCRQHVCKTVKETRLYPVFLVLVEKVVCQICQSVRSATYQLINRDNIKDYQGRKGVASPPVRDSGRLNLSSSNNPERETEDEEV